MNQAQPRQIRAALRAAIERLYETFARYGLPETVEGCECCVEPEDHARIHSRPLRMLTEDDLGKYARKAMTTWGSVEDFKHFLPRLLELAAYKGDVHYTHAEILFSKLTYGEWHTWPSEEQTVVREYFHALWRRVLDLRAFSHWYVLFPWTAYDCICAIAQAEEDVGWYLSVWRETSTARALAHLATFAIDNFQDLALEGRLGNAFWEERDPQMLQVRDWLLSPLTRSALEEGLATAEPGPLADMLAEATDRLSRIPAAFLRPSAPLALSVSSRLCERVHLGPDVPRRRVFVTVSGAHLYGFPSADSDYDLRGAHVLPASAVLGLDPPQETVELTDAQEGVRIEYVSHDVKKYFSLLLRRNGYVLEQIFSPLIVDTGREHEELKAIARTCITRGHAQHYLGFAEQQWKLVERKAQSEKLGPTVKAVLYVYRVLLTGIHLMRTGEVEANLLSLNEEFRLPQVPDLVARKVTGSEAEVLSVADMRFHETEYHRLRSMLEDVAAASTLAMEPAGHGALNDLLLRLRSEVNDRGSGQSP
jgi:predicted nucleotidyltransferase